MPAMPKPSNELLSHLPEFCSARAVLAVVLIAELVAIVLTLASHGPNPGFLVELSGISMFMLWLGLCSDALLCAMRPWLLGMSRNAGFLLSFVLLQVICLLVSEAAWQLDDIFAYGGLTDLTHQKFLLRNLLINMIVTAMVLRYFFVTSEWRRNVALESRAQINALQARIRPHFFFNAMNTIASLTRSDPARAEEAIEDLADLFRASIGESQHRIPLKEELEVARIYQRIEQLRLGDRLRVDWDVSKLPMRALIPGLSVQPILENAIYHGIEPLAEGGTVTVHGDTLADGRIQLSIRNPVASGADTVRSERKSNHIALDNIQRRFALAYEGKADVQINQDDSHFEVRLIFPDTAS